ncbi:MAG: hypothetical protein P1U88_07730 [Thalassobaculaceae bacterium]|nr:hypothetical protein [Thalassobaculaceae bacterium]
MADDIDSLAAMGRKFRARKHGNLTDRRINSRRLDVFKLTESARKSGRDFRPMFRTEALNDCVVSKEVVPDTLKHIYKPHQLATKIYFPYAEDANAEATGGIGGKAVYVNEVNFDRKLEMNFIGSQPEDVKLHDIEILEVFDTLPSLDPFLIRDKFQISDIEVDEVYFEIPKEEWTFIKSRVVDKFRPLARIAFGDSVKGQDVERNTVRLVEVMWDAKDTKTLDPLTKALMIKTEDAGALYYSWKGIVYYEIKLHQIQTDFNEMIKRVKQFEADKSKKYYDGAVVVDWARARKRLMNLWEGAQSIMKTYQKVYDDFFVRGESPVSFRKFFETAEDLFWFLGTSISVIDSVIEQNDKFPRNFEESKDRLTLFYYDIIELTRLTE